jgi:hypothetical protein
MLNQFTLVGKIDKMMGNNEIILNVKDEYKTNGEYKNNYIAIGISYNLMQNIKHDCIEGDVIGVRGTIKNGNFLIGEKITFLSRNKKGDE